MKKVSLWLIVGAIVSMAACSSHGREQAPGIPEPPSVQERLSTFKERMTLTDEQVAAVRPILEEDRSERMKLLDSAKQGDRPNFRELKAKRDDLDWQTYKKLAEVLTADQMEEYSKILDEERAKQREAFRSERKGGGPGGGKGGRPPM